MGYLDLYDNFVYKNANIRNRVRDVHSLNIGVYCAPFSTLKSEIRYISQINSVKICREKKNYTDLSSTSIPCLAKFFLRLSALDFGLTAAISQGASSNILNVSSRGLSKLFFRIIALSVLLLWSYWVRIKVVGGSEAWLSLTSFWCFLPPR